MLSSTKVVVLVCVQIAYVLGSIQLMDECPKVEVDPSANVTDCPRCFDCGFAYGSRCCPNQCGTYSCTFIANSCIIDGVEYAHHNYIALPNNWDKDECGDCWCQNGEKQCVTYSCKGPWP